MYAVALSVVACLRAGTRVDVAWIVDGELPGERDPADALAITPGGGRVGSVLSGAIDGQLVDEASRGTSGRLTAIDVSDIDALVAGLPGGGSVRCLVVPAADLPAELWELLIERRPVCLVTRCRDGEVIGTTLHTAETIGSAGHEASSCFARGHSSTHVVGDEVITVFWPSPKLLVVGGGAIADALAVAARPLGWQTQITNDVSTATGVLAGLAAIDKVVVAAHDIDLAGPVLAAAVASSVGYIGALGGHRMQASRADWLAYRGITDLDRIHGPAGLDIGAESPAEVAISIIAEALALTPSRATT